MQYKQLRDLASILDEESRRCQMRLPRLAVDFERTPKDPTQQPIADLEIWDLVSAFGRVLRENRQVAHATITYDDTPIHTHMKEHPSPHSVGASSRLQAIFPIRAHKSTLVAMFLAPSS